MNSIRVSPRRAFTLIEELIVVAILAILSVTTLMILLDATRVERGVARQRVSAEQLAVLEQAWRGDVHAARAIVEAAKEYKTGPAAIVLEVVDSHTSEVEHRAIAAETGADGKISVRRIRLAPDGTVRSRQLLAEGLDVAELGYDAGNRLCTLRVDATRGFGVYKNRQQFTALAALR
jgi:prepilin-type N-terminal cleavage/methylation domain-containing protein